MNIFLTILFPLAAICLGSPLCWFACTFCLTTNGRLTASVFFPGTPLTPSQPSPQQNSSSHYISFKSLPTNRLVVSDSGLIEDRYIWCRTPALSQSRRWQKLQLGSPKGTAGTCASNRQVDDQLSYHEPRASPHFWYKQQVQTTMDRHGGKYQAE